MEVDEAEINRREFDSVEVDMEVDGSQQKSVEVEMEVEMEVNRSR